MLESRLRRRVAGECPGVVHAARHRRLQRTELVLHLGEVGGAREDVVAQGPPAPGGWALVVERDAGSLLPGQLACLERDLADQRPQERRLARSVGAREREPVASLDLEGDAFEQRRARNLLAQVGRDQDCHGVL